MFKFWLQVWHLFAIAAAFGVSWLLGPLLANLKAPQTNHRPQRTTRAFAGGLVLLLLASLVYPVLSISPRQENRFDASLGPSLDGDLWLQPGRHRVGIKSAAEVDTDIDPGQDRALIDWLQANAKGRPTIVEAVGGSEYQWWGRMSIHTGLPTVLGWRWHQSQQRTLFDFEVNERKAEVAEFYTSESPDRINAFLRAYDVTYVVVGSLELAVANPNTLAMFEANSSLTAVFRDGDRAIYEVDKLALAQVPRALTAVGAG